MQTITTLAMRPLMGAVSNRVGRRRLVVAGLATCSASVTAVSFAMSPPVLVGAMVVYAIGVASTTPATSAFGTVYDVGDAFGPIAAGFLVAAVGFGGAFRTMAALALICAVVFYTVSRQTAPMRGSSEVIPGGR